MPDLLGEELQEPLQLVAVPPESRRERGGVDFGCLERPHVELQPVAELLDSTEHPHGVALGEAAVEQLDVVPDPRVDAAARVDELDREIGRTPLRPQPSLRLHGEDALDDAVGFELGDHRPSLGRARFGTSAVSTITPFSRAPLRRERRRAARRTSSPRRTT